jgi:Zn-dependent M28 family amino/carboxypeptidase
LSTDYLVDQFKRRGLESGPGDGSFLQPVPLRGIRCRASGTFTVAGQPFTLAIPDELVLRTYRPDPETTVRDSGIVFVGYGIVAPEFGWDDYKQADVRGKTVIVIDGEPETPPAGYAAPDSFFRGKDQSVYGTSAAKYEIAGRKGAAAVVMVHDPATAFARFSAIQNNYRQESVDLAIPGASFRPAAIEGRILLSAFQRLCAAAHQDAARLLQSAREPGFAPVKLDATATLTLLTDCREFRSHNVVAKVSGTDPALRDDSIVYTAHWDHLGRDARLPGDQIFNGAIDNAAGVAVLLEIAEAFAHTKPRRTVVFVATTAEEKGYLGARYYVAHPLLPRDRIRANLNLDAGNVWGRTSDVINLGYGLTTLDDVLERAALAQGRQLVRESYAGGSYYFLSDQIEFARAGIPAAFPGAGSSYRDRPAGYGDEKWGEYGAKHYHQVSDEVQADWDLSGAVEDVQWLVAAGTELANADVVPTWKPGAGFRMVNH